MVLPTRASRWPDLAALGFHLRCTRHGGLDDPIPTAVRPPIPSSFALAAEMTLQVMPSFLAMLRACLAIHEGLAMLGGVEPSLLASLEPSLRMHPRRRPPRAAPSLLVRTSVPEAASPTAAAPRHVSCRQFASTMPSAIACAAAAGFLPSGPLMHPLSSMWAAEAPIACRAATSLAPAARSDWAVGWESPSPIRMAESLPTAICPASAEKPGLVRAASNPP